MSVPGFGVQNARGPGSRNGLPFLKPYVYRGKLPLEVELPYECPGGCGRRLESVKYGPCAVCRGAWEIEDGRRLPCAGCGYSRTSQNHRILCGNAH